MAGASLLTLLDDIAAILDDVALMTKVAAGKTAGVLSDDLAVNAEQVAGVKADRELPVVWAVAKGSLRNKAILVPAALLINALLPSAVKVLLIFGGLFLCHEGFEKLYHKMVKKPAEHKEIDGKSGTTTNIKINEKQKINGAIRTDFVLSAEIIAITLGVVANTDFITQITTLTLIAVLMTIGVYGVIAGIVKLDDVGLYLTRRSGSHLLTRFGRWLGDHLVNAAPYLMRGLTVIGTLAMFMVGGGIIAHGIPIIGDQFAHLANLVPPLAGVGTLLSWLIPSLLNTLFGITLGALILPIITVLSRLKN